MSDLEDARKLRLDLQDYLEIKKEGLIKKCKPEEECSIGEVGGVLDSLLSQYELDEIINLRMGEFKKAKELFVGCSFGFTVGQITKNDMAVCIPAKDNGIDLYLREIDGIRKDIVIHPIQICELIEKYMKPFEKEFHEELFDFIKDKKFNFDLPDSALLVWVETESDRRLEGGDITKLRELFEKEEKITYQQIIIANRAREARFNFFSVYSRHRQNHFAYSYDFETSKLGKLKI